MQGVSALIGTHTAIFVAYAVCYALFSYFVEGIDAALQVI